MKVHVLLALAAAVAFAGCTEKRSLNTELGTFEVHVTGNRGTEAEPLPFPEDAVAVDVTVQAISNRGQPMTDFDGEVTLFAAPGRTETTDGLLRVRATLENGQASAHIALGRVYGRTHVCARDDLRQDASTYASACSETLYFAMPTLRQVQLTNDGTTSPLVGSFIEVRRGDMIVTGIQPEGFFLTDLTEAPGNGTAGNFGSLFIFSYSFPEDMQIGDRVESVTGTVQEFTGATQLVFPSWVKKDVPTNLADLPTPTIITEETCGPPSAYNETLCAYDAGNMDMESLESAVVKVQNVKTPTRFVDCDINQDGNVLNYDPSCAEGDQRVSCQEIACKSECNLDPLCSELSSYHVYGQWSVAMNDGAGPKINVLTREGFPEFDPLAEENKGISLDVAGNLRHSLPARPRWIIVARMPEDVTVRR